MATDRKQKYEVKRAKQTKKVNFFLSNEEHKRFSDFAKRNDMTLTEFFRKAGTEAVWFEDEKEYSKAMLLSELSEEVLNIKVFLHKVFINFEK